MGRLREEDDGCITVTWETPAISGARPGGMAYHFAGALPLDPHLVLFYGGLNGTTALSTLMVLDTRDWVWIPIEGRGQLPPGRYGMAAAIVNDKLWIVGGADGVFLLLRVVVSIAAIGTHT